MWLLFLEAALALALLLFIVWWTMAPVNKREREHERVREREHERVREREREREHSARASVAREDAVPTRIPKQPDDTQNLDR